MIRYHAVLRLGKTHPVAAVSKIARDREASDRSIANRQPDTTMPIIGRWRVTDHAPLIADLCGPMGRGKNADPS